MTFTGDATMWMAVFADMGANLLVVGNGFAFAEEINHIRNKVSQTSGL